MHCFVDWIRPTIDCPITNVIETFKELACHCPTSWLTNKHRPHLLFLRSKLKWRFFYDIWFKTTLIDRN